MCEDGAWLVLIGPSYGFEVTVATAIALAHVVAILLDASTSVLQRWRRLIVAFHMGKAQVWNVRNTPELLGLTIFVCAKMVVKCPTVLWLTRHGACWVGVVLRCF